MSKHEILLVDDDPQILSVVSRVLEDKGYQITEESSGEAAVQALRSKDFDLVITDLDMYETDGFTVLKKAKEQNPETMVILFTGGRQVTSFLHALQLGFDDYIIKPSRLDELLKRVANCFERLDLKRNNARLEGERKQRVSPLKRPRFQRARRRTLDR